VSNVTIVFSLIACRIVSICFCFYAALNVIVQRCSHRRTVYDYFSWDHSI